jgi:tRNA(Ile)-lysidine synthase
LQDKVYRTITSHNLSEPGHKLLVAISGGPDSLALLHLLHGMSDRLGISLHAAHIHHGLRPEADAEAIAVKKQAILLGVPVSVCRVNVKALQKQESLSLQAAARQARYGALLVLAKRIGAERIATAHHQDDRVETMLMRLLSGSGLDGLAGIPLRRRLHKNIEVIRPLHGVSRPEIEAYCIAHRLKPLWDPSNNRPVYLRNRIRLRLLPYLEREFGAHVRRVLTKTADNLALDAGYLGKQGRQAYLGITESRNRDGVWLDTAKLAMFPPALQKRALRHALWDIGVKRPGWRQVEQLEFLAKHKSPSAQCRLPDGIVAQRRYTKLWLGQPSPLVVPGTATAEIQIPGWTFLTCSGLWLYAETLPVDDIDFAALSPQEACLDADTLSLPLTARSRRDGDRMHPLGAPGNRKIKKILSDRKIPLAQRGSIPVIICGENIVWLGGVEIAEAHKVTAGTETVLYMKLINKKRMMPVE